MSRLIFLFSRPPTSDAEMYLERGRVPIVGDVLLGNVVSKEASPRNIGYGWPTVVSLMAASALGLGSYHAQGTMSVCSIGATPEVPAQTSLVRQ